MHIESLEVWKKFVVVKTKYFYSFTNNSQKKKMET